MTRTSDETDSSIQTFGLCQVMYPTSIHYFETADDQVDPVEWWKAHAGDLRNWAKAFRLVANISPAIICSSRKGIFYTLIVFFVTTDIIITS